MADVQFNEGEAYPRFAPAGARVPVGMAGFLVKRGWAKDARDATYMLATIIVVAVVIGIGAAIWGYSSTSSAHPRPSTPDPLHPPAS